MYITDSTSQLRYIWQTSRADGGVLWQDLILAVEDEPPSSEGVHEPLPCAQLTLGIDPRRTDPGVGDRLVEGSPNQLGGQVEWESGNKRTIVCLTSPSREASYDPGARRVPPQDKEGLL
jgi:hypothetical protein